MTRSAIPADIDPAKLTAIIDSREQTPLDLSPLRSVNGTLCTGDYSLVGLEHVVRIERKSLQDLVGCVGHERERFDREVVRLLGFPVRCLIVESTWEDIEVKTWRGNVTPAAVIGSLMGWIALGLPVLMAGYHARAGKFVARMLVITARRRWRELRALHDAATDVTSLDDVDGELIPQ